MLQVLGLLRSVYRLLPLSIRRLSLFGTLKRLILNSERLPHSIVYDEGYFHSPSMTAASRSAPIIAASILEDLSPTRVIDVGCGGGALLEALRDAGCTVFGLDYSEAAIALCQSRGLEVKRFDIETDTLAEEGFFDVAVSTEVAEHLPERVADRYVDLLTNTAGTIVFTAAPPGETAGTDHANVQPSEYWISKFASRHFVHNQDLSAEWRKQWRLSGKVVWRYCRNPMIFHRSEMSSTATSGLWVVPTGRPR